MIEPVRTPVRRTPAPGARPASRLLVLTTLGACLALGGCSTMHVKRAAYQVLRQEDCRMNQLESFCRRNFANEYHEYERLRRSFMREASGETWRVAGRDAAVREVVAGASGGLVPIVSTAPAVRAAADPVAGDAPMARDDDSPGLRIR